MIGRLRLLTAVAIWQVAVLAQDGDANSVEGGHRHSFWHMMGPWSGGVFMWLLFLVVAVIVIYFLIRGLGPGGSGQTQTPQETPLDILKKRYARGEITKEQFDEMKKNL